MGVLPAVPSLSPKALQDGRSQSAHVPCPPCIRRTHTADRVQAHQAPLWRRRPSRLPQPGAGASRALPQRCAAHVGSACVQSRPAQHEFATQSNLRRRRRRSPPTAPFDHRSQAAQGELTTSTFSQSSRDMHVVVEKPQDGFM